MHYYKSKKRAIQKTLFLLQNRRFQVSKKVSRHCLDSGLDRFFYRTQTLQIAPLSIKKERFSYTTFNIQKLFRKIYFLFSFSYLSAKMRKFSRSSFFAIAFLDRLFSKKVVYEKRSFSIYNLHWRNSNE